MKSKTITYKRILNIKNFNSKQLEEVAEVEDGEDPEVAISKLMERVERKLREELGKSICQEIERLQLVAQKYRKEVVELEESLRKLRSEKDNLTGVEAELYDVTQTPQTNSTPDAF
ncbi:hypothetical protein JYQ62_02185 [Nostoc sp. UHCC 0702]|nr:hypothetical protein JYQ62_02185 [Nostoc sp. UHCC 0702]